MSADGYEDPTLSRLEKLNYYANNQSKLNGRLKEIAKEISELPQVPSSMDEWIATWTELDGKNFGIDTYLKRSKIKKEYNELIDSSDANLRELRILAIEDLIEKINNTLNK